MAFPFPDLPIVTPPAEDRLSVQEKYGGLFYLGLAGLVALVTLIVVFAWGVAANWTVWTNIYKLNDSTQADDARIEAADTLARDPRLNQRQYWDLVIRPDLPLLGRYRIAEALTAGATVSDPAGYAKSVAQSTGWPDWLRALLVRPMAYAANRGGSFPAESIQALKLSEDPFVRVWATYVLALQKGGDPVALAELESAAATEGPAKATAGELRASLHAIDPERKERLDAATLRLRTDHPEAAKVWDGWKDAGGRLVRKAAPDLHTN